ncbi:MAG: type IV pilus assembly protein PilM [Planctomycetes bacterium]|nr:type IV pilus assembly protein PilM [Planctomycetota bacterium]
MASKQPVWGIDVGQCSLKAMKLQAAGDKVELLGFDIVEHEQVLSQVETDAGEMVKRTINTFASRNDLANSKIVVSVPGQQTLTRFTKMPPVDAKKIPDMVQYEASQQIPFDMDEVVWDYQVFTEGEAAEVEVGIFAMRKELIRNYLQQFTSQRVEPMMVQTSPMASFNAARYELELPAGETFVLLDMGALATDLIVMEGQRIWARPIPIGGNKFTDSLVTAFKVPFAKAEKLKKTAAASKYARQIFAAMRPVFADLVSEVQRSVGYYTSTHRDSHITRIVGMGNAFKLPGLQKFLQQNVQMKVDKFPGFAKLVEVSTAKKTEFDENQMSLGVAYGLALQGLELAAVNSNLLPLEVRRTLLWKKKQPWFIGATACLALSAGSIFLGNAMASSEVSSARGGVEAGQVRPQTFNTVDNAMSALSTPAGDSPVKKAMQVAGAAQFLKKEFAKYTGSGPESGTLGMLAKFPANNVFVPSIIDVIHRSFEEVTSPELKSVKTPEEYLRIAERVKRQDRKEIWIDQLQMAYATDPGAMFSANPDDKTVRGGPGWGVLIKGTTTEPNPATWIEDNLKRVLLELGGKPDMGFYIDTVTLSKVMERSKKKGRASDDSGFGGSGGGGDRSPGGRRSGGGRQTPGGGDAPGRRGGGDGPSLAGPGGPRPACPVALAAAQSGMTFAKLWRSWTPRIR